MIYNSFGIFLNKIFHYQMIRHKELITINLYMLAVNYLLNVDNFFQHQHFLNFKEINTVEYKLFHFSIML